MKKSILIAGAMLVLGAGVASAAGVNLSWNDCGAFGQPNQTFACNTNSGINAMVGSFIPPANVNEFLGISAQVDITTDQATLPPWWQIGTGQCRATTSLTADFGFLSNTNCADPYQGAAAGGSAYDVGFGSPARARFRIQGAIPIDQAFPVDPSTEYYAFRGTLTHTKTTGAGNCVGCSNPGCIVLNEIQLFQPPADNFDPEITNPATSNFVTWQTPSGPLGCPLSTPTKASTWGQVKSLYR